LERRWRKPRLVLGERWLGKRLKAMRFGLISLPGQVVKHARGLYLRLSGGHPGQELLVGARQRMLALAQRPPWLRWPGAAATIDSTGWFIGWFIKPGSTNTNSTRKTGDP
jgi:hypothetical protein